MQTSATSVVFDSNKLQEVTESNTLWSVVCAHVLAIEWREWLPWLLASVLEQLGLGNY